MLPRVGVRFSKFLARTLQRRSICEGRNRDGEADGPSRVYDALQGTPSSEQVRKNNTSRGVGGADDTEKAKATLAGYTIEELLERISQARLVKEERVPDPQRTETHRDKTNSIADIDGLVDFLKAEGASDVCVIRVPPEREYVEFFVVCSGVGTRHICTIADNLVTQVRVCGGEKVRVDGRDSEQWMAVDLGFAVVHVMLDEARQKYELEKLWTLGPEFDDQTLSMLEYEKV